MNTRLNCVRLEDRPAPANLTITNAFLRDGTAQANKLADPVIGQQLYVRALWSGTGLSTADSYVVRFTAYGYTLDSSPITGFTGGSFNWNMAGWYAAPGPATVTITLDPNNVIAETDENDNTFNLIINPATPTDLPSKFLMPVGKQANVDWAINNYADVDPRPGLAADYKGGPYQYDGHDALDAGPWGFDSQDAGIPLYAAGDGTVTQTANGQFDRNTVIANVPGNYVLIDHGNSWETLYFHFANNTITVRPGDVVKKGQLIGLMGSSGSSTGTHIHYTPYYKSLPVESGYAPSTYWDSPLPYGGDVPMFVFDAGVTNYAPDPDGQERISAHNRFSTSEPGNIYVWLTTYGLKTGDLLQWQWIRPNGTVHSTTGFTLNATYRFSWWYWFRPLSTFQGTTGNWQVALRVNGVEKRRVNFNIISGGETASARVLDSDNRIVIDGRTTPIPFGDVEPNSPPPEQTFTIQNHGALSLTTGAFSLPPGFSIVGTFPSIVPSFGTASFTVKMDTDTPGRKFGTFAFGTNDPDTPIYNFLLEGKVNGSAPVNSPVITLNDGPAVMFNHESRPRLLAPTAAVTDPDSQHFSGGSLTVGVIVGGDDGGDRVSIRHQGDGPGQVGFDGTVVRYEGVPIGVATGVNTLTVAFTSVDATPAAVQAVARAVTYQRNSLTPTTARRSLRWTLTDDVGNIGLVRYSHVTHSGVTRNPTLPTPTPITVTRGAALSFIGSFNDPNGLSWTGTADYGDGSGVQPLTIPTPTAYKLSHVYTSPFPNFAASVTVENHQGGWSSTVAPVTVVAPAKLTSISVDDGTLQRSLVRSLTLTFDRPLTTNGQPFAVTRDGGNSPTVSVAWNAELTQATLTFSGPFVESGSLQDGKYTLSIDSKILNDATGGSLDGDGDGLSGGAYTGYTFHRLFGDTDGNASVNFVDFLAFRTAFGNPVVNPVFDFNNDGVVNFTDFLSFRTRFGTSLAP